jgi:DNA-binding transcriptional MerR regulator
MTYTVGELASRTGLTTRTLHHYETLGLLQPAQRSPAGYRLYDDASLAQLHAVLAYRYLGLPLKDIAALLADDPPPLAELLRRQAAEVEERIARHQRLLLALQRCTRALDDGASALDDALLAIITATRLCEESLPPEDHRRIAQARASFSADEVAALQADMAALMQAMEQRRAAGADPRSAPVIALAQRLRALRDRVVGSDPAFHARIRSVAARSPGLLQTNGVSPELFAYARAARQAMEDGETADRVDADVAAPARRPKGARAATSAKGDARSKA